MYIANEGRVSPDSCLSATAISRCRLPGSRRPAKSPSEVPSVARRIGERSYH